MDLIGYTMDLESLISRYTFLIFTEIVPIILVLFLTWFLPYLKKRTKKTHNKHKTKRKVKLEMRIWSCIIVVCVVSLIF